jgi:hypothetical protein
MVAYDSSKGSTVRAGFVAVIATALLMSGCSSSKSVSQSATTLPNPTTTDTIPAPAGLPAFYSVPNPLPAGPPGTIIRAEKVKGFAMHGTLWRVMYKSQSIQGTDIAVTGLIAVPTAPPAVGGYPVITLDHGSEGAADMCAPSLLTPGLEDLGGPVGSRKGHNGAYLDHYLDAGYLVTRSDYPGLGTPEARPTRSESQTPVLRSTSYAPPATCLA